MYMHTYVYKKIMMIGNIFCYRLANSIVLQGQSDV